jgi:hypothetical protein
MNYHGASDALENPVIVFDEHLERADAVDAPIHLRYRQPSFTLLGICPTPKGFNSLSDFRESRVCLSRTLSLGEVPRPLSSSAVLKRSNQGPP